MKQGTSFILPVKFDYDLSTVSSILFLFKQDGQRMLFTYPSDSATLSTTNLNTVNIHWSKAQTYKFTTDKAIKLDTRIHLNGSDDNPATTIIEVKFSATLFDS